jgi:hypothetical protein
MYRSPSPPLVCLIAGVSEGVPTTTSETAQNAKPAPRAHLGGALQPISGGLRGSDVEAMVYARLGWQR